MTEEDRRLPSMERECRRLRAGIAISLFVSLVAGVWTARPWAQLPGQSIRVRELIIEDTNGRPRMVFGAPISDGSGRTGL